MSSTILQILTEPESPLHEPEHGWCWRCHVHPIRSRHAVLCETCLAAVHAQPAVGHA